MIAESAPGIVDLANLEWWQSLVGILGLLGLSPAPWLLGLATGRIQFSAPAEKAYDTRLKEQLDHHVQVNTIQTERYTDLKESRNYYRDAYNVEHERANKATETVAEVLEALNATNHVLSSITKAAEEVAK